MAGIFMVYSTLYNFALAGTHPMPDAPTREAENLTVTVPPSFDWASGNILLVKAGETYKVTSKNGNGWPSGSIPSANPLARPSGTVYQILVKLPNGSVVPVTTDMVTSTGTQGEHPDVNLNTIPHGNTVLGWADPFVIIEKFPTATNRIVPSMEPDLATLTAEGKKPHRLILLHGQSSRVKFGACYVTPDYNYIATVSVHREGTAPANAYKVRGNRKCNEALAYARTTAVHRELLSRGVPPTAIRRIKFASWGIRPGGQLDNQAVIAVVVSENRVVERTGEIPITPSRPEETCPECTSPEISYHNIPSNCLIAQKVVDDKIVITVICIKRATPIDPSTASSPPPPPKKKDGWYCKRHPVICGVIGTVIVGGAVVAAGGACGEGANGAGDGGICPPW